MSSIERETQISYINEFNGGNWILNVYLIMSDKQERILENDSQQIIEQKILELEQRCMSEEFHYFKIGFAFLHYGKRGVDLSIWHLGNWGNTFEIFCCSWYCYGRDTSKMELLNSAEPVLSQYEIKYLVEELKIYSEILQETESEEDFRRRYMKKWKGME